MKASGAIATAATHGPAHNECVATRQTWQVACQVAVKKGAPQRRPAPQARSPPDPHGAQRHRRPRPRAAAQRRDQAENVAQAPRESQHSYDREAKRGPRRPRHRASGLDLHTVSASSGEVRSARWMQPHRSNAAARWCCRRFDSGTHAWCGHATVMVLVSSASGPRVSR
jgi:hypothetical protein